MAGHGCPDVVYSLSTTGIVLSTRQMEDICVLYSGSVMVWKRHGNQLRLPSFDERQGLRPAAARQLGSVILCHLKSFCSLQTYAFP